MRPGDNIALLSATRSAFAHEVGSNGYKLGVLLCSEALLLTSGFSSFDVRVFLECVECQHTFRRDVNMENSRVRILRC